VFVEALMDAGRLFHTAGLVWLSTSSLQTVFNLGILYTELITDRARSAEYKFLLCG